MATNINKVIEEWIDECNNESTCGYGEIIAPPEFVFVYRQALHDLRSRIPELEENITKIIFPTGDELHEVGNHYWGGDYEPTYQELEMLEK